MKRKLRLLSLMSLSLVSVAGISMAIVSCGDNKDNEDSADLKALKALFVEGSDLTKTMTLEKLPTADIAEKTVEKADFDTISKVTTDSELKWVGTAKLESFKDVKVSYVASTKMLTLKKGEAKLEITLGVKEVAVVDTSYINKYVLDLLDAGPWTQEDSEVKKPTLDDWKNQQNGLGANYSIGNSIFIDNENAENIDPTEIPYLMGSDWADSAKTINIAGMNKLLTDSNHWLRLKTDVALPEGKKIKLLIGHLTSSPNILLIKAIEVNDNNEPVNNNDRVISATLEYTIRSQ